jgi:hypothetical protein
MNLDDSSDDETPLATLKKVDDKKKCLRCCKWLPSSAFAINPKSKALYSKCETCRPKHAASQHTSRNDKLVSQKVALEAGEALTTLICHGCGPRPIEEFGINAQTGKPNANCKPCNAKMLSQKVEYKKTDKGKATEKRYQEGNAGKATQRRFKTSEKGKATNKKYDTSEKGKAAQKRAKTSEKGKATQKRAKTSEKGKAKEKRYREGDAGQATLKRFSAKRQKRRQESPAMRLAGAIKCAADHLLAGRIETSPTFLERTSFDSEAQFLAHMEAECRKNDLVFEDRGSWTIDRKIPEEAYDFDNRDDVLRCWLPSNITAMTHHDNMEKSWKLTDWWIASAGPACYPLSWQNRPPTEEMKMAHADRMMAPKPVGEQLESPASNESDSEEGEFEACGDQGAGSSSNAVYELTEEEDSEAE